MEKFINNVEGISKNRYKINSETAEVFDTKTNNIKPTRKDKNGYILITLDNKTFRLHRLVMMTFNPIADYKIKQVNHKNGIKTDNSLNNLEWCTSLENVEHSIKTGLRPSHSNTLINEEECKIICEYLEQGYAPKMIAQKLYPNEVDRYTSIIQDIRKKPETHWAEISKNYNFPKEYKYGNNFKSSVATIWQLERICELIVEGKTNDEIVKEVFGTKTSSLNDLITNMRKKRKYEKVSRYYF